MGGDKSLGADFEFFASFCSNSRPLGLENSFLGKTKPCTKHCTTNCIPEVHGAQRTSKTQSKLGVMSRETTARNNDSDWLKRKRSFLPILA